MESEARFRGLVGNIPGAVFRCDIDSDWTMEFLSDAIEELVGYPSSDFIDNRVRTFASVVHPDDRERLETDVASSFKDGRPYTTDYRVIHRDGTVRYAIERGQAVNAADGRVRLDGAIFDVTDRRLGGARAPQARRDRRIVRRRDHVGGPRRHRHELEQGRRANVRLYGRGDDRTIGLSPRPGRGDDGFERAHRSGGRVRRGPLRSDTKAQGRNPDRNRGDHVRRFATAPARSSASRRSPRTSPTAGGWSRNVRSSRVSSR